MCHEDCDVFAVTTARRLGPCVQTVTLAFRLNVGFVEWGRNPPCGFLFFQRLQDAHAERSHSTERTHSPVGL